MNVMDDWKLKTSPVVRLEIPSETFVHFVCCTIASRWQCFVYMIVIFEIFLIS